MCSFAVLLVINHYFAFKYFADVYYSFQEVCTLIYTLLDVSLDVFSLARSEAATQYTMFIHCASYSKAESFHKVLSKF